MAGYHHPNRTNTYVRPVISVRKDPNVHHYVRMERTKTTREVKIAKYVPKVSIVIQSLRDLSLTRRNVLPDTTVPRELHIRRRLHVRRVNMVRWKVIRTSHNVWTVRVVIILNKQVYQLPLAGVMLVSTVKVVPTPPHRSSTCQATWLQERRKDNSLT